MLNKFKFKSLVIAMGMTCVAMPTISAEQVQEDAEIDEIIVVVGSRAAPRSIADSPVPVDVIGAKELMANGTSDMNSLLRAVTPSYNVSPQAISDGATVVRPANLRGLSPDSTLILVNGKRRHRASVITFSGGGIADGAQGPDVSTIPAIALKQIEILRDGASAQYGSDAVAGVINFVLKDNDSGGQFELKAGQFSEGDGEQVTLSGNFGLSLSDNGFANFSFEVNQQEATSRSTQRSDAQALIDAGNTSVADPAQTWGSPKISDDFKLFLNTGIELANGGEAYMFGNWSEKTVEGGFFFRNPQTKSGVFKGPVLDDGTATLLVADLTPGATDNSACPLVPIINNVPDADALASLASANCYAHNLRFPGGFTPFFGGEVVDLSLVMGTRGEFSDGTSYDFSGSVGEHSTEFHMSDSVNSSMGPNTPTEFTPGAYAQLEKSINADFSKELDSVMGLDYLVVSYGLEFRHETFTITAGDEASWQLGPLVTQGFSIGSNGFPGFKPADAGASSRTSKAVYFDTEANITEDFLAQVAFRYEDFSDFGSSFNWKLAGMYDINESFKIRTSVSTGFRAPTIGQNNVRAVQTQTENGILVDVATLPPTHPVSVKYGGIALTPEQSISYSLGMVYQLDEFFLTVDYFNIEVTDRITQTSSIKVSDEDRQELIDAGVTDAIGLSKVKFFTNDFDTTTQGFDVVANYSNEMFGGEMKYGLAYNWTETTVDKYGENVNQTKLNRLEKSLPEHKGSFTVNYQADSWSLMARANYFGEWSQFDPDIPGDAAILLDTEFAYYFDNGAGFAVGINNLTDDNGPVAEGAPSGRSYSSTSPYGFNGRFVYAKVTYSF
ncbi:TonB-dependent receptor plug domain-containing protein [Colwellia sp. TT2012]|uniref:TonB-dependent receptor plug domain-containing protein n=1 Tax=Colwellia sp. TT2012 TaxID=1720342 RepID=UPI00070BA69F|nr:TonB-dependent receptor [Colwellia sp. TT2012]